MIIQGQNNPWGQAERGLLPPAPTLPYSHTSLRQSDAAYQVRKPGVCAHMIQPRLGFEADQIGRVFAVSFLQPFKCVVPVFDRKVGFGDIVRRHLNTLRQFQNLLQSLGGLALLSCS